MIWFDFNKCEAKQSNKANKATYTLIWRAVNMLFRSSLYLEESVIHMSGNWMFSFIEFVPFVADVLQHWLSRLVGEHPWEMDPRSETLLPECTNHPRRKQKGIVIVDLSKTTCFCCWCAKNRCFCWISVKNHVLLLLLERHVIWVLKILEASLGNLVELNKFKYKFWD